MEIRSNNIGVLQFGRRQTLGLTQNLLDYNNNDQYIVHVKGNNGTSALQFQADAASFYKPMFFTTSDGNFRLKGSAAGTDFFEMGSSGTSNAGEMEFIIGDDGAEPFIFKRYDYRDGLNKELFRIQGSGDFQTAKPRVGINTGQLANSTLQIEGSVSTAITSTNTHLTLDETHHTVIVNSNSTISLPAPSTCNGRYYIIKNTTNGTISISSFLDSSGATSTTIEANSSIQVQSNGSNWHSFSYGNTRIGTLGTASNNDDILAVDASGTMKRSKINYGGRWTNTNTSTDLNVNNGVAPIFGNQDYVDDGTSLFEVSGNTLTVKETGRYDIRANLFLVGSSSSNSRQRTNVNARIAVNGIPIGATGASGYIRFASGHDHSSIHLNEVLQLNTNDIISVITFREANAGSVHFDSLGSSSFIINKLR